MTPRPYQIDCLNSIKEARDEGITRQLVVQATGLGKAVQSATIPSALSLPKNRRMMTLVHRDELAFQMSEKIERCNPGRSVGIEKANLHAGDADIVVASVQTIGGASADSVDDEVTWKYNDRIRQFRPDDFDILQVDECVSGDTLVETDYGPLRIDDPRIESSLALSYDEVRGTWTYQKVLRLIPQGKRVTLQIQTSTGRVLRCTQNHPILTTSGWKMAGKLIRGEMIISPQSDRHIRPCAAAAVAISDSSHPLWLSTVSKAPKPTGRNILISPGMHLLGPTHLALSRKSKQRFLRTSPCARVGAVEKSGSQPLSSPQGEHLEQQNLTGKNTPTSVAMGLGARNCFVATTRTTPSARSNLRGSMGHSLETLASATHPLKALCRASRPRTVCAKRNGPITRLQCCPLYTSKQPYSKATGMGNFLSGLHLPATSASAKSTIPSAEAARKKSHNNGLGSSLTSRWLGGIWTTGRFLSAEKVAQSSDSTRKDTPSKKTRSCESGLTQGGTAATSIHPPRKGEGFRISQSQQKVPRNGFKSCVDSHLPAWSTSLEKIVDIQVATAEPVYDIEVANTHTFVANGILVHNCHHLSVRAKQWSSILRYMRVMKGDEHEDFSKCLVGWTATPSRADNLGLESFFDKIVYNYGIREAINDKWLAQIQAYRVETEVDISKVKTTAGDFNVGQLSHTVNTPERNELLARKYREISPGLPSLFFTTDIQHSIDVAETMTRHGWRVYPLSGKTPEGDRRRLLQLMKDGQIHGIASCAVISEGTDIPNAEAGYMLRPTKSGLLYQQQVGRLLRPSPAPEEMAAMVAKGITPKRIKPHAIIVDFCDVSGRHSLISTPTLFGLRADFDTKGKKILEAVEQIEQLELENPGFDIRREASMDAIRSAIRSIDLLKPPTIPPEIRACSRFSWLAEYVGSFRLGLMDGSTLTVREDTLGTYAISRHTKGVKAPIATARSLPEAIAMAEREIPEMDKKVMHADAGWRTKPPTEKQAELMFRLDRRLKQSFPSDKALFEFYTNQFKAGVMDFSRGGLSTKIDSLRGTR